MKIHEYQAKGIVKRYGLAVPRGEVAETSDQGEAAAQHLFGAGASAVVVKAQIHAGGRGKGGGVKIAKSMNEAGEIAAKMLGMKLVTHQTGPEGRIVRRLLIEETHDAAFGAGLMRRPHRAPLAHRRDASHREGAVFRHSRGSRRGQAGVHGVGGRGNGNRASRRRESQCHSEAAYRPGHGPGAVPGTEDCISARAQATTDQPGSAVSDWPLSQSSVPGTAPGP